MADHDLPSRLREGSGVGAPDAGPVTITIEPGPGNRLGVLYDMLRDLGLEQCCACHVWKPTGRIAFLGYDHGAGSPTASFTEARCTACILDAHPDLPAVAL